MIVAILLGGLFGGLIVAGALLVAARDRRRLRRAGGLVDRLETLELHAAELLERTAHLELATAGTLTATPTLPTDPAPLTHRDIHAALERRVRHLEHVIAATPETREHERRLNDLAACRYVDADDEPRGGPYPPPSTRDPGREAHGGAASGADSSLGWVRPFSGLRPARLYGPGDRVGDALRPSGDPGRVSDVGGDPV
jgi:hypothetical protein